MSKKRKTKSKMAPVHTQEDLGRMETTSNLERGLISLPVELTTEVLEYFPDIGPYTAAKFNRKDGPFLLELFFVRIDILRALSQVCVAYRRVFLPLLWDSVNLCFRMRRENPMRSEGQAVIRKCEGLSANPDLASYIGTVRAVILSYSVIPTLSTCLSSLQNLHTLHVGDIDPNLISAIKSGFQGVVLPRIHTLIIPNDCQEILKRCPRVTKVWCNRGNGGKLVTVIAKYCKEVQEMRGFLAEEIFNTRCIPTDEVLQCNFLADERLVKRIIEAAPNLRVLDMNDRNFLPIINALPFFKNINTIIIKASGYDDDLIKCINATKQRLKDLGPSNERRHIRIWHRSNDLELRCARRSTDSEIDEGDTNAYIRGYYTEVEIE